MRYLILLFVLAGLTACNTTPEQWQQAQRSWNSGMPQQQQAGQQCTVVHVGNGIYDKRCH